MLAAFQTEVFFDSLTYTKWYRRKDSNLLRRWFYNARHSTELSLLSLPRILVATFQRGFNFTTLTTNSYYKMLVFDYDSLDTST